MSRAVPVLVGGFLLLAAASAQAAPLVNPVRYEEPAEDDATPDGCWHKFICYKPPGQLDAVEWVGSETWKYIIIRDVGTFVAALFLPFPAVWMPFLLHFVLVPDEVRPPLSGDLLMTILVQIGLHFAAAYLLLPIVFIPVLGYLGYIGINGALNYWIAPVTLLHAYNRAMKAEGQAPPEPPRKKKSHRPKPRRRVEEDDED